MRHKSDTLLTEESQKKHSLVDGTQIHSKGTLLGEAKGRDRGDTELRENTQEDKRDPVVIEMV
jgi:hypothetical protein